MVHYSEKLLEAIEFATEMHAGQFWKDYDQIPYINHIIGVLMILIKGSSERDEVLLIGAVLHDIVEDTPVGIPTIRERFGAEVAEIVDEMTDDMTVSVEERHKRQFQNASSLSPKAKKLKIADKTANIRDVAKYPIGWSPAKKEEYLNWAKSVVDQLRGSSPELEAYFDEQYLKALDRIALEKKV